MQAMYEGNPSSAINDDDDKLLVKFFIKPVKDSAASQLEGREIFKDTEYVEIRVPGSRSTGACRRATKGDKERFPKHYAAFKNRISDEEIIEGTPLAEWPGISRSRVEELAYFNVRTVEQLANMADTHASQMMGMMELRSKAAAWLQRAKEEKDANQLQALMIEMKKVNQEQQETINRMAESNADLETKVSNMAKEILDLKKPKKGRPKKSE